MQRGYIGGQTYITVGSCKSTLTELTSSIVFPTGWIKEENHGLGVGVLGEPQYGNPTEGLSLLGVIQPIMRRGQDSDNSPKQLEL